MKRLHALLQKYYEESKELKNAYKSLPDGLALEMEKDLQAFYEMERDILFIQVKRENLTENYYESYKSEKMIPADVDLPWYKRIFRKVKKKANAAALQIRRRVDDEVRALGLEESAAEPDGAAAGTSERDDVQSAVNAHARRRRVKKPPADGSEPALVEVQTPLGPQIKLQLPAEEKEHVDI